MYFSLKPAGKATSSADAVADAFSSSLFDSNNSLRCGPA